MSSVNEVRQVVTDYGPDPHNPSGGVFKDALMRLHGFLVPATLGADGAEENTFHGYVDTVQNFRGAANPASTNVVFRTDADISSAIVEGQAGNAARRIFADRLRRRSGR